MIAENMQLQLQLWPLVFDQCKLRGSPHTIFGIHLLYLLQVSYVPPMPLSSLLVTRARKIPDHQILTLNCKISDAYGDSVCFCEYYNRVIFFYPRKSFYDRQCRISKENKKF